MYSNEGDLQLFAGHHHAIILDTAQGCQHFRMSREAAAGGSNSVLGNGTCDDAV